MRLKIFSDVHLEFGPFSASVKDADVIIAAGDIGVQLSAIEWLKRLAKPVIYVAGNHEYWNGDLKMTIDHLRAACQGSNIHFLEQDSVVIDGVHFLGCTLWTDFNAQDEAYMEEISAFMNDFHFITNGEHSAVPGDVALINKKSRAWLKSRLKVLAGETVVVVTHHAPSTQSWNFENKELFKNAYCNDMEHFIKKNAVNLWVHGHVHDVFDYQIGSTRVICNARGYYDQGLVKHFVSEKIVEL